MILKLKPLFIILKHDVTSYITFSFDPVDTGKYLHRDTRTQRNNLYCDKFTPLHQDTVK